MTNQQTRIREHESLSVTTDKQLFSLEIHVGGKWMPVLVGSKDKPIRVIAETSEFANTLKTNIELALAKRGMLTVLVRARPMEGKELEEKQKTFATARKITSVNDLKMT